jgi:hypothetical protein
VLGRLARLLVPSGLIAEIAVTSAQADYAVSASGRPAGWRSPTSPSTTTPCHQQRRGGAHAHRARRVDRVTVALGATVLASAQSACQNFALAPCPSTGAGTLDVDTAQVPDGTYPVILTADDASGDSTPVQAATSSAS